MCSLTGIKALKQTVLQGGFSVGQSAVLKGLKADILSKYNGASVRIKEWRADEGKWLVQLQSGRRKLAVEACYLHLSAELDGAQVRVEKREVGKDRPCSDSLASGDLVQFKSNGYWQDAAVVQVVRSKGNVTQVKIISTADCTEMCVPFQCLRQKENYQINRRRKEANDLAKRMLQQAKLSKDDVLEVLRIWAFAPNSMRGNVIPEGKTYVFSDTFGLVTKRTNPKACAESQLSKDCPDVMRLLSRWMKENTPKEYEHQFPYTSINLNFGYNAKLHRDARNEGPSLLRSLGEFTGGKLAYYPDDNQALNIESLKRLPSKHKLTLDISTKFHLIDGNRAHSVDHFDGERFSVVFFTCRSFRNAAPKVKRSVIQCGATWPKSASMEYFKNMLSVPKGYDAPEGDHSGLASANPRKRKAQCVEHDSNERQVEELNTHGKKYKLLDFPHLNLKLTIGKIYSTGSLAKRCHGDQMKLTALRRRLQDTRVFQPV